MVSCGTAVVVSGERLPALSISWEEPSSAAVQRLRCLLLGVFARGRRGAVAADRDRVSELLIEDGDEQLARGLDLARVHGQADFDPDAVEWFVPEDES